MKKYSNDYFVLVPGLAFFFMGIFLHENYKKPEHVVPKQESALNINREFLKFTSLGNKRLLSSLVYVQTLMEGDLERHANKGKTNWMYHRFRTIAELDPLFYENYLFGGMYLSIIKDDLEGAAEIYELGIRQFPSDYKLNYNAGFNYYYEMRDIKKGIIALTRIETHPDAPPMLKFIINKLKVETSNDYSIGLAFLEHSFQEAQDPMIKDKIARNLYSLKAQRDLECLNLVKTDCEKLDSEGNSYLFREGKWMARKPFREYRVFRRNEKKEAPETGASR